MKRKTETITLSIHKGTKKNLEEIAENFGIYWGDRPSISGLLNAIAKQEVAVSEPMFFDQVQIQSMEKAVKALVDVGQMQAAQVLMELLLEKGNIENIFREDLTAKLQTQAGAEAWRRVIDNYIEQRQPFFLVYENNQGEQEQFHVTYGEITFHEKRLYLDAWCEEENENPTFPIEELKHNHSFHLERIISALNYPSKWRYQGLNHIQVHLHFYDAMIKAYQQKKEDIEVKKEKDKLKVVKRISNPFWLIREIYPYRDKCEIISPPEVRNKYLEEWEKIGKRYGKISSDVS